MMRIMERHRHLDMIAIATALLLVSGCAAGKETMTSANSTSAKTVEQIVYALIAAPPASPDKAQTALGVTLTAAPGSGPFRQYKGRVEPGPDGRSIDVEYRMPQTAAASAGPLLILKLDGPCLAKAEVQNRYGPLQITDVPRGKSLDEEASFSRTYAWGTLSFGFAERNRDCLRTIVYNLNKR
jgi:hypothetical protein